MEGLVARAGLCLEDIGGALVVGAVVVDNDHEVAVAVVVVDGVEGEVVPSLRAVERTGVDPDGGGGVECYRVGRVVEGGFVGGLEVDGAIDFVGHGGGVVEVVADIFDVHRTAKFGTVDDGFGEGVVIIVIDWVAVCGASG